MLRNVNQVLDALTRKGLVEPQRGRVKKQLEDLKKKVDATRSCMWPRCRRPCIDSHVVSDTFLSSLLSEGELLLTPKNPEVFVSYEKAPRLAKVAPKSASTFPGFCRTHDNDEFKRFENLRRMEPYDDMRRQLIRTSTVEAQNREDLMVLLKELLSPASGAASILLGTDLGRRLGAKLDETIRHYDATYRLMQALHRDLHLSHDQEGSVAIHHQVIEPGLGVALSYVDFVSAAHPDTGQWIDCPIAIAIVPLPPDDATNSKSVVVTACPLANVLEVYVRSSLSTPSDVARAITSWMARGCFSWWVSPTWWDGLSGGTRADIKAGLTTFHDGR